MSNPPTENSGNSSPDVGPAKTATPSDDTSGKTQANSDEAPNSLHEKETTAVATPTTSSDGGDEDDDENSIKSVGADEEDALFTSLEQNEEQEKADHPQGQPKDAKAAPMLLQSALATGDVLMDDSNSGSATKKEVESNAVKEEEKKGEEVAEDSVHNNIVHQRVRNKKRLSSNQHLP